jgi:hypothetical protein
LPRLADAGRRSGEQRLLEPQGRIMPPPEGTEKHHLMA